MSNLREKERARQGRKLPILLPQSPLCRNRPRGRRSAISSLLFAKQVIIVDAMEKSNLEVRVERIEKVVDDIQRDVKAMDTRMSGMDKSISARMAEMDKSISARMAEMDKSISARMAGMDARMARVEALMEGVSHRVVSAEQKAEKTESRLWFIVIAVIVAGGIPALITKILSL